MSSGETAMQTKLKILFLRQSFLGTNEPKDFFCLFSRFFNILKCSFNTKFDHKIRSCLLKYEEKKSRMIAKRVEKHTQTIQGKNEKKS